MSESLQPGSARGHPSHEESLQPGSARGHPSLQKSERLYTVLLTPHITEKASNLGDWSNQYTFKVAKDATKREIRKAVETLFGVKVRNVTTLNVKGKVKRNFRGVTSRMKGWKKAYVRLAEGENLDYTAVDR